MEIDNLNVWLVFAYDSYYPMGGSNDLRGSFKSKEDADVFAASILSKWDNVEVIDITEDLVR